MSRPLAPLGATLFAAVLTSGSAFADSFQNASTASQDSAEASARLAASGAQITLGAVALPLQAAGEVTAAVGQATSSLGAGMWDVANEPLTVSEEVLSAVPPPDLSARPTPAQQPEN